MEEEGRREASQKQSEKERGERGGGGCALAQGGAYLKVPEAAPPALIEKFLENKNMLGLLR